MQLNAQQYTDTELLRKLYQNVTLLAPHLSLPHIVAARRLAEICHYHVCIYKRA